MTIAVQSVLKDQLVIVLLDYGGEMNLGAILEVLRKRGVEASKSAVVNTFKRNPARFVRKGWGIYALKLSGNGRKR